MRTRMWLKRNVSSTWTPTGGRIARWRKRSRSSLPGGGNSREEAVSGNPKGFVMLARNGEYGDRLKTVSLLREHR
ncbi:MAG: hypothetical protein ACXWWY_13750 [Candidatus Deferrimicrobiaceae bacterium]